MVIAESGLHWMHAAVRTGNAFNRHNVGSIGLHCEHVAALHGPAVHVNRAGAALRGVASDVGTG